MAKDVDLSSKEWTDIVFENRNKEFGAYELRSNSDRRHNLAVLYVLLAGLAIGVIAFLWSLYSDYRAEVAQADILASASQEVLSEADVEIDIEEEEIEENQMDIEEPEPEPEQEEALQEEILNTQQVTQFLIVPDDEEVEEVKTAEDIKEDTTAIGAVDFSEGTDDADSGAREHKDEVIVDVKTPEPEVKEEQVFVSVEQMPTYPGGDAALLKWISEHIKYPAVAAENNIQGRVTIQFVVEKDGSIGEVKVARGKDPDLDKEAVRVVKSIKTKFAPGRMNGNPVRVWYTLPINFKLAGN